MIIDANLVRISQPSLMIRVMTFGSVPTPGASFSRLVARGEQTHRLGPLCAGHQLSSHQHPLLRQAAGDDSNESLDAVGIQVGGS